MAKKYFLDRETLTYKPIENGFTLWLKRSLKVVVIACIGGTLFWTLSYVGVLPSVKSTFLAQLNQYFINELAQLNQEFDHISNKLAEIQDRDDNCYRVISKQQPLPATVRQAGFGGVNKYENLMGSIHHEMLIESNLKSDIILSQIELQANSYDTVYSSILKLSDSINSVPAIQPVSPRGVVRISSLFGSRVHPITGIPTMHDGIDMAGNIGTPIYCTGKGVVINVGYSVAGYGNKVVVDHGFGFKTLYAHLNEIIVKEGQEVVRGTQIGTMGNTGSSTGPHLHYEVIFDDKKINPINYYLNDLSDTEYREMIKSLSATK